MLVISSGTARPVSPHTLDLLEGKILDDPRLSYRVGYDV
jgi:hypothetical protein